MADGGRKHSARPVSGAQQCVGQFLGQLIGRELRLVGGIKELLVHFEPLFAGQFDQLPELLAPLQFSGQCRIGAAIVCIDIASLH